MCAHYLHKQGEKGSTLLPYIGKDASTQHVTPFEKDRYNETMDTILHFYFERDKVLEAKSLMQDLSFSTVRCELEPFICIMENVDLPHKTKDMSEWKSKIVNKMKANADSLDMKTRHNMWRYINTYCQLWEEGIDSLEAHDLMTRCLRIIMDMTRLPHK